MPFNNNFQKINQLLTDTYVGLTNEIWDKINFKFNENQKQTSTAASVVWHHAESVTRLILACSGPPQRSVWSC